MTTTATTLAAGGRRRRIAPRLALCIAASLLPSPGSGRLVSQQGREASGAATDGEERGSAPPRTTTGRTQRTRARRGQAISACAPPYEPRQYAAGEIISHLGANYACLEFPYDAFCGRDGYAPSENHWMMAWKRLDECEFVPQQSIDPAPPDTAPAPPVHVLRDCAPPYQSQRPYRVGEYASSAEHNYECQVQGWCGMDIYAPGAGAHSDMAWKRLDPCKVMLIPVQDVHPHHAPSIQANNAQPAPQLALPARTSIVSQDAVPATPNLPDCAPAYQSDYPYAAGDKVSEDGNDYECLVSGWCRMGTYAPGVGYWGLAWECQASSNGRGAHVCAPPYVWRRAEAYAADEIASWEGRNYKCGIPSWCSSDAYVPGTDFGNLAWKVMEQCEVPEYEHVTKGVGQVKLEEGECPPEWTQGKPYALGQRVTAYPSLKVYECHERPSTLSCRNFAPGESLGGTPDGRSSPNGAWVVAGRCLYGKVIERNTNAPPLETTRPTQRPTQRPTTRPTNDRAVTQAKPDVMASYHAQLPQPASAGLHDCAPAYVRGEKYVSDDIVSNGGGRGGGNFRCNNGRHCSSRNPRFEPGRGRYWTLVWTALEPCGNDNNPTPPARRPSPPRRPVPARKQSGAREPYNMEYFAAASVASPTGMPTDRPTETPTTSRPTASPINPTNVPTGSPSHTPCPPSWAMGYNYKEGELASVEGKVYRCKGHPYTAWCGLSSQYEPGAGQVWEMAWEFVEGGCGEVLSYRLWP